MGYQAAKGARTMLTVAGVFIESIESILILLMRPHTLIEIIMGIPAVRAVAAVAVAVAPERGLKDWMH